MIGVLNLETSNKEKLSAKVPDNRKEITEITETELKELEKEKKKLEIKVQKKLEGIK